MAQRSPAFSTYQLVVDDAVTTARAPHTSIGRGMATAG
jgi:hypothetical protein